MNRELVRLVWDRAGDRCEYCLIPQFAFPLPFQIDHIIAEKHQGETVETNLALACPHCNRFKGPNIAGLDSASGQLVRLFSTHAMTRGSNILLSMALESPDGHLLVGRRFRCSR